MKRIYICGVYRFVSIIIHISEQKGIIDIFSSKCFVRYISHSSMNDVSVESNFGLTNKNMTTGAVIQMHLSAEDEAVELTSLVNSTTITSGMDDNDCNRVISWEQDEYKESNSMQSDGQDLDKISKNDISTAVVKFDRLIVDTINPTTLHLDWAPCSQCLSVSGYKIRYNIMDNACYNEIFVTHGITSYTISGLKPNTEYDVCVNAMDQHQKVICSCGNVTQRTDPMMKDKKRYDVPYMAVITAACLLIIAALVPLTFLLLRECVKCDISLNTSQDKDPSGPLKQPNLVSYGQPIYENSN